MTHEQFITLETAKLAKQAGFDWESRFDNQQQCDEWQQVALVEVSNPDYNDAIGDPYSDEFIPFMSPTKFVMLPHVTQSVLQRWLREVKNLQIWSEFHNQRSKNRKDGWIACYGFYSSTIVGIEYTSICPTYEAALEAGLQKCLTLLIEKQ